MKRTQLLSALVFTACTALSSFAAAKETYEIDAAHSTVIFRAGHLGIGAVYGRFRAISGEFTMGKKPADQTVKLEIDPNSVYTAVRKRDEHLKGPDFLNAKQFGTITFVSTKVKKVGKAFKVTGKLTLHGVTKTVTVTMKHLGSGKDPLGNYRAGFEGNLVINRMNYGITHMKGAVGNKIGLTIAIEGIKKE